jgi:hypothetical protein
MNNARADMFHDLVCEHRKLSDAHSKLRLELSQKGNPSTYSYMPDTLPSLLLNTFLADILQLVSKHKSPRFLSV